VSFPLRISELLHALDQGNENQNSDDFCFLVFPCIYMFAFLLTYRLVS